MYYHYVPGSWMHKRRHRDRLIDWYTSKGIRGADKYLSPPPHNASPTEAESWSSKPMTRVVKIYRKKDFKVKHSGMKDKVKDYTKIEQQQMKF